MKLLCVTLLAILLVGCVTKPQGRMAPLMEGEVQTCDQADIALSEIDSFEAAELADSRGDLRSWAAYVTDFGLGNKMERNAARASAHARRVAVLARRDELGCRG